jgi:exonuclease VII small subunit
MKSLFCKKHYIYLGLAALSLSLAITSHVFAQSPTTTEETATTTETTRDSDRDDEDAEAVRDEAVPERATSTPALPRTMEVREQVETRRGAIVEATQNRLINLARNMKGRMDAAIDRLDQIVARLERRIGKLAEEGVSTETATRYVNDAKTALREAESILGSIDGEVIRAVSGDSPREKFSEIRRAFQAARDLIIEAHGHLRNAIGALRNPVVEAEEDNETATSTDQAL